MLPALGTTSPVAACGSMPGDVRTRRDPAGSAGSSWGVRIALVLALAFSVAFPGLPQFEGKGMAFRAPFYLLPMGAVPLGWHLRGRRPPYPFLADALVVSPFLVDTLGNALNFYNTFDSTDDVLHFVNWVLLVGGITLLLLRTHDADDSRCGRSRTASAAWRSSGGRPPSGWCRSSAPPG